MILIASAALCSQGTSAQTEDQRSSRGAELYASQCAQCHGQAGRADGPASYLLFPPARDFSRGRFKLTSTQNGVPTDEDLVATLRRGMPGSAMPGWSWMPDSDLEALATHVRGLAVAGIVDDLRGESSDTVAELWKRARKLMTPGAQVEVSQAPEATPEVLKLGRSAYLSNCASCHGNQGRGRGYGVGSILDDQLNWPRDFTLGLLKGGASHADIDRRIQVGMHGSDMPASELETEERAALIAYVRSLISASAKERFAQSRETLRAMRLKPAASWEDADEVTIVLAPLWWRDAAILEARVAARHDGKQLWVRIQWEDPTPDAPAQLERPQDAEPYADSVALQLSADLNPPFFGMGSDASSMNIWHWKAIYMPKAEDILALLRLLPHRMREWFTEEAMDNLPLYQLAQAPIVIGGQAVAATPAGMQPLDEEHQLPSSIRASPTWDDGTWEVILSRSMESSSERELELLPGRRVAVNFAIWNGSARDLRGQKSISIWHVLELEP